MKRSRLAYLGGLFGPFVLCSFSCAETSLAANASPKGLPHPLARQDSNHNENVVLTQADGDDDVRSFFVTLPESLTANEINFVQKSSNPDVIEFEDNQNLLLQTGEGQRVNVTLTAGFDSLVGKTVYTFECQEKGSGRAVASYTIHYTVSGMSFYTVDQQTQKKYLLSETQRHRISYEDVISSPHSGANEIRVIVQYPENSENSTVTKASDLRSVSGTAQDQGLAMSLPRQSGLEIGEKTARAQYIHNIFTCSAGILGTNNSNDGLMLPSGCGYGLYWNDLGELCFGVKYEPYRYGDISFSVEWDSLVESDSNLAEEGYTDSFGITITGIPPIVVTRVEPVDTLFRPEGGQIVKAYFYNGELHASGNRQILVAGVDSPFKEIGGSYVDEEYPSYQQWAIYLTEPGVGTSLPWSFQYISSDSSVGDTTYKTAILASTVTFTVGYDTNPITIGKISPAIALETGGMDMTIDGYFNGFDRATDGVFFNGMPLSSDSYQTVGDSQIVITVPSRTDLGGGYDFGLYISVGNAQSAPVSFQYTVTEAKVKISQSGTTQLGGETVFRMGDCTPARMTAVISPFTAQVATYEWSLFVADDESNTSILSTFTDPEVESDTQTIEIQPKHLEVGNTYELTIKTTLPGPNPGTPGAIAVTTVTLVRENAITIGAYILEPSIRSVARPEAPYRLSCIVKAPTSECYNGTAGSGLVFEWSGFNRTERYAPSEADGQAATSGEITVTPARLGWEFIVPQNNLTAGEHEITFKAWMEDNPLIQGSAKRIVTITNSPLEAVIRGGETRMTINAQTSLNMTAANSVDPDEAYLSGPSIPLSYSWTCLETDGDVDFSDTAQVTACDDGFLPSGAQAESFTISKELISAVPQTVTAMKYELIVTKEGRISPEPSDLTLILNHKVLKDQQLTGFNIEVEDITGNVQSTRHVKYYQPVVISVSNLPESGIHWTYSVFEPIGQGAALLRAGKIIGTAGYFNPESNSNNQSPLGFQAFALTPFTTYTIKINFSGGEKFEDAEIYFTFRTSAAPKVNFPVPSVMNGTTLTQYTATAGTPVGDSEFIYFFFLQDSTGKKFCIGGCTGYGITYFRIGRVGSYTISVLLFDSQGQAQLNEEVLDQQIIVSEPEEPHDLFSELDTLFLNGDDSSWTQLAFDLASQLAISTSLRMLETFSVRQAEDVSTSDADKLLSLANGLRKILCASRPSSGHGELVISIATVLSGLPLLRPESVYDIVGSVTCGVANTPAGTSITFRVTSIIENLGYYTSLASSDSTGNTGRRRLLQLEDTEEDTPYNLRADILLWSGLVVAKSETSSKGEGFSTSVLDGNITVVVASSLIQLPAHRISDETRYGLAVGKENSNAGAIFYAKDECSLGLFGGVKQKRWLSVQSMNNFMTADRFQSYKPPGGFLSDRLFLVQVYQEDEFGQMSIVPVVRPAGDACYCMKLPLTDEEELEKMANMVGTSPSSFTLTDLKEFGKDISKPGTAFNYNPNDAYPSGHSIALQYVDVCSNDVGFTGSTKSAKSGHSLVSGALLFGSTLTGIVGMVLAGLLFIVVAVVASWVVATRSMAAGEPEPVALAAHELYVERDIYGRGTIFANKSKKPKIDPVIT